MCSVDDRRKSNASLTSYQNRHYVPCPFGRARVASCENGRRVLVLYVCVVDGHAEASQIEIFPQRPSRIPSMMIFKHNLMLADSAKGGSGRNAALLLNEVSADPSQQKHAD